MEIGKKLRALREERNMSQGDIEKPTGLLRCYLSRVENGHTVPAIETLQKLAKAMNVPFHMLFFDGPGEPKPLKLKGSHQKATAKDDARFAEFAKRMAKMNKRDRNLFVMMAAKMAKATEN
jgi:transcriptional regulator with XRE-family HTH domain